MKQKRSWALSTIFEYRLSCVLKKVLRHIVQELQKETLAVTQRNKLLEAALDAGDHSSVLSFDLQTKHEVSCGLCRHYS